MVRLSRFPCFACLLMMVTLVPAAFADDKCSDILRDGTKNTIAASSSKGMSEAARDWFCSDRFERYVNSSEANASIKAVIEDLPLEFGGGQKSAGAYTSRDRFCADKQRTFSESATTSMFTQVADKDVVATWKACMLAKLAASSSSSVTGALDPVGPNGEQVNLSLRWQKQRTEEKAPTLLDIDLKGLSCKLDRLFVGTTLAPENLSASCEFQGDYTRVGSAIVSTSAGPVRLIVPRSLAGKSAGRATLVYTTTHPEWKKRAPISKERETGDHHCSHNCEKNPTRTSYMITIKVAPNWRLSNPKLTCVRGPCEGWHDREGKDIDEDGTRARGWFDMWTHPQIWRLTADQEERVDVTDTTSGPQIELFYGRPISIAVPKSFKSAYLDLRMRDNTQLKVPVGGKAEGPLVFNKQDDGGDQWIFTYTVKDE